MFILLTVALYVCVSKQCSAQECVVKQSVLNCIKLKPFVKLKKNLICCRVLQVLQLYFRSYNLTIVKTDMSIDVTVSKTKVWEGRQAAGVPVGMLLAW